MQAASSLNQSHVQLAYISTSSNQNLGCEMGWYEVTNAHFHRLLQAMKAGWSPGNDDKVSTFNSFPNILLDGWEALKHLYL